MREEEARQNGGHSPGSSSVAHELDELDSTTPGPSIIPKRGNSRKVNGAPTHVDIPPPAPIPFTLSRTRTHGWDSPWVPFHSRKLPPTDDPNLYDNAGGIFSNSPDPSGDDVRTGWAKRRRRFRTFLLYSNYVPLVGVFRSPGTPPFCLLSFPTSRFYDSPICRSLRRGLPLLSEYAGSKCPIICLA